MGFEDLADMDRFNEPWSGNDAKKMTKQEFDDLCKDISEGTYRPTYECSMSAEDIKVLMEQPPLMRVKRCKGL